MSGQDFAVAKPGKDFYAVLGVCKVSTCRLCFCLSVWCVSVTVCVYCCASYTPFRPGSLPLALVCSRILTLFHTHVLLFCVALTALACPCVSLSCLSCHVCLLCVLPVPDAACLSLPCAVGMRQRNQMRLPQEGDGVSSRQKPGHRLPGRRGEIQESGGSLRGAELSAEARHF